MTPFPSRFVHASTARATFGSRIDRLGGFLSQGDPLADGAAIALRGLPRERAHELMDLGARKGPEALEGAPREVRDYFDAFYTMPLWADRERADRGGRVLLRTAMLSGLVLAAKSLMLGYAAPGGNKPLIASGALTERAPKRLNETACYVRGLAMPGGIFPGGDGFALTAKVRLMHAFVRTELLAKEAERGAETSSFRWNCNEWGVPINQHDMAATTLLFSKELLDGLVALGTSVSAEAREDYMHLWRIGGHLMGVVSELLPTSTADGAALTAMILATQGDPDDDSRALAQALFASGAQAAQNEAERTLARRQGVLLRAVSRELLGDKIADALGVQPTPFQKVIPVVKRMIASAERVQKLTGDGAAVKAGTAYWNTLRDVGLSRYGFGFELPTLLAME